MGVEGGGAAAAGRGEEGKPDCRDGIWTPFYLLVSFHFPHLDVLSSLNRQPVPRDTGSACPAFFRASDN